MRSYNAPGPDGYQAIFFKRAWDLLGGEVHSFVKGVMEGGEIPRGASQALLVLILKEMRPASMKDFRSISLCNTTYKIISKILVSKLKEAWRGLILPFQASFVPGRQSSDNVILCQEFIHSFRFTKAKRGEIILKVDLEKAYDRLEWMFIEETLHEARIPDRLVCVIMR